MLQKQQNLGRRFGTSKMHFILPQVAKAAVRSKAVVLLLLIQCWLLLTLRNCSIFCCALKFLCVHFSFAIILMGKRELVALFCWFSWCLVIVVWLFYAMPWAFLQFAIVEFPDHTHFLILSSLCVNYCIVGQQIY